MIEMKAEERQKRIEEYLQKAEFASLEELARHVDTSISTVRRDVTALETAGNVRRTHGGARLINPQSNEFVFSLRDTLQLPEKEAIGLACANLIPPGQSVIIDSGTTVFHAAQHLEDHALHVITNSLPVANLFASSQHIEVMVSGGVIYPRLGVLVGPLAVDAFTKINADVAIMSGGGITLDGITNSHALLIDIQQAMIRAASKVIFCLDHTKFGRRSVAHLCDLSIIDCVVTDAGAPPDLVQALRNRGLEVIVAPQAISPISMPDVPSPAPIPKRASPLKKLTPINAPRPAPATEKNISDPAPESSDSRMGWD
jgi:DeoR/GlpR family transcriptional regulator of sugar metabolism